MRYQVDALRSKGNTALSQLLVANIDQTKRKKERKKLGADHHQKDRHSTPSNGQMLHLSIRVGSHAAGRFPRAITRVYQYETNPYFVCYSLNHRGPPGKVYTSILYRRVIAYFHLQQGGRQGWCMCYTIISTVLIFIYLWSLRA